MNPFSTHLVLLNKLFDQFTPSSIFEYGMGLYSTPFFLEKADEVISVEMQYQDWYDRINEEFADDKFTCVCKLGPTEAIDYFESLDRDFDMVFVDGVTRWLCINKAFSKTKVIVTHDTEHTSPTYGWDRVDVPEDWVTFTDAVRNPYTTIYYHNSLNLDFSDLVL